MSKAVVGQSGRLDDGSSTMERPMDRLSFEEFCAEVKAAVLSLPEPFFSHMANVVVDVLDEPSAEDWAAAYAAADDDDFEDDDEEEDSDEDDFDDDEEEEDDYEEDEDDDDFDDDDDEEEDDEELEDELFGLFIGLPVTEQAYGEEHPNRVKIFRAPLERVSANRADLRQNIRDTVLHELAHHFGYTEDDLVEFESTRLLAQEEGDPLQ
jgi:predicted Zn-dependent protease with MMP-like domain